MMPVPLTVSSACDADGLKSFAIKPTAKYCPADVDENPVSLASSER